MCDELCGEDIEGSAFASIGSNKMHYTQIKSLQGQVAKTFAVASIAVLALLCLFPVLSTGLPTLIGR